MGATSVHDSAHSRKLKLVAFGKEPQARAAYLLCSGDRDGGRALGLLLLEPGVGVGGGRGRHGGIAAVVMVVGGRRPEKGAHANGSGQIGGSPKKIDSM